PGGVRLAGRVGADGGPGDPRGSARGGGGPVAAGGSIVFLEYGQAGVPVDGRFRCCGAVVQAGGDSAVSGGVLVVVGGRGAVGDGGGVVDAAVGLGRAGTSRVDAGGGTGGVSVGGRG